MLSSPRRPSNTMRIFSSAEYCLRVARRMSWTTFSAGSLDDRVCCLIFAPVNVTMSQKLSLLQSANSVSRALTADIPDVLQNPPEAGVRGKAHGSIRIQEGEPNQIRGLLAQQST